MILADRSEAAPSVHETFAVTFSNPDTTGIDDRDALERVLASTALAEGWRAPLIARRPGGPAVTDGRLAHRGDGQCRLGPRLFR